jgi:hypothetical protein
VLPVIIFSKLKYSMNKSINSLQAQEERPILYHLSCRYSRISKAYGISSIFHSFNREMTISSFFQTNFSNSFLVKDISSEAKASAIRSCGVLHAYFTHIC